MSNSSVRNIVDIVDKQQYTTYPLIISRLLDQATGSSTQLEDAGWPGPQALFPNWETSTNVIQISVPWEDTVDKAYEHKRLKYAELAEDAKQHSWRI